MRDAAETIRTILDDAAGVIREVRESHVETIERMVATLAQALRDGHKLLFCGNGGSSADAQHLAAEFLVRLRPTVNRRALPALALGADAPTLTAYGNDYGFEGVFARLVEAFGERGDVLVALSTSGDSANVVAAAQRARARGLATVGLLGRGGGALAAECDTALIVPSDDTGRIQEVHAVVGHALAQAVEDALLADGTLDTEAR